MFVVIYRWHVALSQETDFQRAWSRITSLYVERWKSGGSALFRAEDGTWVGIARWQSREARARASAAGTLDPEASAVMRTAIIDRLPDIELECIDDQWVFPIPPGSDVSAIGS